MPKISVHLKKSLEYTFTINSRKRHFFWEIQFHFRDTIVPSDFVRNLARKSNSSSQKRSFWEVGFRENILSTEKNESWLTPVCGRPIIGRKCNFKDSQDNIKIVYDPNSDKQLLNTPQGLSRKYLRHEKNVMYFFTWKKSFANYGYKGTFSAA